MKKLVEYIKKLILVLSIAVLCYFILGVFQMAIIWVDMKAALSHAKLAQEYERFVTELPNNEKVPEYREKAKEAWEKSDKLEKRSNFLMKHHLFKIHEWE